MENQRILLVLWDGGGVVPPLIEVARRLIARGHEVVVLGDPTIAEEAAAVGAVFHGWTRAPHRQTRDRSEDIIRDYAFKSQQKFFKAEFRGYFIDSGPDWTADVLAAIDEYDIDAILCDFMLPWASIAAEARKLPCTVLVTFPYPVPTAGFPPQGSALMPVPGFLEPPRDAVIRRMTEWFYDKWIPTMNLVRASLGLPPLTHAMDQVRNSAAVAVLTARAFDYPGAPVPANVFWAGPMLDDPSWVQPWQAPWEPDNDAPLVVVGMSSTFQDHVALLQRIVDALATLPVRAIVSRGPSVREGEVVGTSNVVVVDSVPHDQVLPQASVLVTHCGHGTAMKGLAAGVPMMCIPIGRDQTDNAARIVHHGIGVKVKPTAGVVKIRAAIEEVLGNPSYRAAAVAMAETIAAGSGQSDIVTTIEATMPDGVPRGS